MDEADIDTTSFKNLTSQQGKQVLKAYYELTQLTFPSKGNLTFFPPNDFYFMYIRILPACLYVQKMHAGEGVISPETGIIGAGDWNGIFCKSSMYSQPAK